MNKLRKQSDSTYPMFFMMVDDTDHITGKTGLSPTVTISKNGASFASPSGAVTEVGNGLYKIAGNTTDSNTLGELWIHATGTAADPTDTAYTIVPYNPFDGVRMGLTALPNANAEASGGLFTRGTGAGQINQAANGQIDSKIVTIATDAIDASSVKADAVTKIQNGLATPTNITAGTITTVTNLTNAPTSGDLTATMKASVTTAATAATPTVAGVTGVVSANVTQINGGATNGNNAVLKLKSLDIISNDVSVNAVNIQGANGTPGQSGGHGLVFGGGSAGTGGTNGGDGIRTLGGGGGTVATGYGVNVISSISGQTGVHVSGKNAPAVYYEGDSYGAGLLVTGGYNWDGGIEANIKGSVGALGAQAKVDVNAEVKDVLETDTQAEPTGVPAASSSFKEKIGWIFARLRNKQTFTKSSGIEKVYADDSTTEIGTSTDTDDGTIFTKEKMT